MNRKYQDKCIRTSPLSKLTCLSPIPLTFLQEPQVARLLFIKFIYLSYVYLFALELPPLLKKKTGKHRLEVLKEERSVTERQLVRKDGKLRQGEEVNTNEQKLRKGYKSQTKRRQRRGWTSSETGKVSYREIACLEG